MANLLQSKGFKTSAFFVFLCVAGVFTVASLSPGSFKPPPPSPVPAPLPHIVLVDPPSALPPTTYLSPSTANCSPARALTTDELIHTNRRICEDNASIDELTSVVATKSFQAAHPAVHANAFTIIRAMPYATPDNFTLPPPLQNESDCVREKIYSLSSAEQQAEQQRRLHSTNAHMVPHKPSTFVTSSGNGTAFIPAGYVWKPSSHPRNRKALVVMTSCCSLWPLLEEGLASLFALPPQEREWFDILVVDDYSRDGTADRARQLGVPVISPKGTLPLGLTFLWNTAYRAFKRAGYAAMILSNNDVIVPPGVVLRMLALATIYEVVAPLTTAKGAGYLHESQGVQDIFGIPVTDDSSLHTYVQAPSHTYAVSEVLRQCMRDDFTSKSPATPLRDDSLADLVAASNVSDVAVPWHRPLWKPYNFNGFFWAVSRRVTRLEKFRDTAALFHPCNPNVGNEVEFAHRMHTRFQASGEIGRIGLCLSCFVYHHKGKSMSTSVRNRNDLRAMHSDLTCEQLQRLGIRRQLICAYQKLHKQEFWGSEGCKFKRQDG